MDKRIRYAQRKRDAKINGGCGVCFIRKVTPGFKSCKRCRAKVTAITARRKANHTCISCTAPPKHGFKSCEKHLAKYSQYIRRLKTQVMAKYGGKCACCGVNELEFLTIDHTNSDGHVERKTIDSRTLYRKLAQSPKRNDIQAMCWNCNLSRHFGNGVCVHRRPS